MSRLRFVGLILLVGIWGAVLSIPVFRYVLQSQIQPQPMLNWDSGIDIARVAAEHPNDSRVLAAKIEIETARDVQEIRKKQEQQNTGAELVVIDGSPHVYDAISVRYKARVQAYDALIKKFPDDAWLLQNRLRNTQDVNIILTERETPKIPGAIYAIPPKREALLQGLKIAERGVQLEPQNSFYDWMRAIFLFTLHRDNEALAALREGSKKNGFDDGVLRDVNNKIAVWQMQEPLFWEERFWVMSSELLPHFALMHKANRIALGYAKEAERKGNHVRALELYESQWKLGRTIVQRATLTITAIVGQGFVAGSWQGSGNLPKDELQAVRMQKLAEHFAVYARRHQRPDLAREAEQDAGELGPYHRFDDVEEQFFQLSPGQDARAIYRWKWFGRVFLYALFWCGLAWLIMSGGQGMARRMSDKASAERVSAASADAIAGALFVVPAFGLALVAAWCFIDLETISNWAIMGIPTSPLNYPAQPELLTQFLTFDRWLPFIPFVLAFIYCLVTAMWRARKEKVAGTPLQGGSGIAGVVFLLTIAATLFFILQQVRLMKQLSLDQAAVMSWLPLYAPVLGVVAFLLYLIIRFGKSWFQTLSRTFASLLRAPLLPNTLLLLVVILSVGYLASSLLALPVRREADQQLDIFLQRGEVAMLRDRAASQEP